MNNNNRLSEGSSISFKHETCDELKRNLPQTCGWTVGNTEKSYTITKLISGGIEISSETELNYVSVIYTYQCGYFNPWMQSELFELYLQSKGLPGSVGIYRDKKYSARVNGLPGYRSWDPWKPYIELCLYSQDELVFNSLAKIIEAYCVAGYHPGSSILQKMLAKYSLVQIESRSIPAYHDEDDVITVFYNASNEVIAEVQKRDYSWSSGVGPLCDFLKENTGETQVFGLAMAVETAFDR